MSAWTLEAVPAVRVDVQMGRIDVIATPRSDVTVTVSPSNPGRAGDRSAAEKVTVDRAGDRVVVAGQFRLKILGPGDSVDVVVEVPEGTAVEASTKFGSAHLAGRLGAVRADVAYGELTVEAAQRLEVTGGHGDFRVTHVAGDAELRFKSGSARLGRIGGALRLTGSDGAIAVESVVGRADVVTSSGGVELGMLGEGATVRSAYGAVRVREAARGVLRVDGSYGDVAVGIRTGTAVWLDASSKHGVVRTDLATDAGPGADDERLELRVRTGYGSITVHRCEPTERTHP